MGNWVVYGKVWNGQRWICGTLDVEAANRTEATSKGITKLRTFAEGNQYVFSHVQEARKAS